MSRFSLPIAAIVAATALVMPAATMAHTPAAAIACHDGRPQLRVELVKYDPAVTNTVRIRSDGDLVLEEAFGASWTRTIALGSGYLAHHATVKVTTADDPDGSRGWSRTFDLRTPPCKTPRERYDPRASVGAWCADPMTRYTLDNTRSTRPATFVIFRESHGAPHRLVRHVGAGRLRVTHLKHVDGGTITTVRTPSGRFLAGRLAPVTKWAGPC